MAALRGLALERAIEGPRTSKRRQREIVVRSALAILGPDEGWAGPSRRGSGTA
jgi:hypothetical protein